MEKALEYAEQAPNLHHLRALIGLANVHGFRGEMQRQVFWWKKQQLPELGDLKALSEFDGILMDVSDSNHEAERWQDRFVGRAADIPFISFADVRLQKRWLLLTMPDDYVRKMLNWTRLS